MTGGDEYKAAVVGFDEDKDVAVLKINVENSKVRRPEHPQQPSGCATDGPCGGGPGCVHVLCLP